MKRIITFILIISFLYQDVALANDFLMPRSQAGEIAEELPEKLMDAWGRFRNAGDSSKSRVDGLNRDTLEEKRKVLCAKLREVLSPIIGDVDFSGFSDDELVLILVCIYEGSQIRMIFPPDIRMQVTTLMARIISVLKEGTPELKIVAENTELLELASDYFAFYFYLRFYKDFIMRLDKKDRVKRHNIILKESLSAPLKIAKTSLIETKKGEITLDVGTGFPGIGVISEAEPDEGIWLLDKDPFVVRVLERYAGLTGKRNTRVIRDDAAVLSKIEDASVSAVVCEWVFQYESEGLKAFFDQAKRVLKDGGVFKIAYTQAPADRKRLGAEIKRITGEAGIRILLGVPEDVVRMDLDDSDREIAKTFDVSSTEVCRLLSEAGFEIIDKEARISESHKNIAIMINARKKKAGGGAERKPCAGTAAATAGAHPKKLIGRIMGMAGLVPQEIRGFAIQRQVQIGKWIQLPGGQEKLKRAGFTEEEISVLIDFINGRVKLKINKPDIFWGVLFHLLTKGDEETSEGKRKPVTFRIESCPIRKNISQKERKRIVDIIRKRDDIDFVRLLALLIQGVIDGIPVEITKGQLARVSSIPGIGFNIDVDNIVFVEEDVRAPGYIFVPFTFAGENLGVVFPKFEISHREFMKISEVLYESDVLLPHQYIWGDAILQLKRENLAVTYDREFTGVRGRKKIHTITPSNRHLREWLVSRINNMGEGLRILSVGAGKGDLEDELKQAGHKVVCVDISKESVSILKGKGLEAMCGDAHELSSLVSGKFDLVLFPEVVGYLQRDIVYNEARKVLKENGHVIVLTYPENPLWLTPGYAKQSIEAVKDELRRAGFNTNYAVPIGDDQSRVEILPPGEEKNVLIIYIEAGLQKSTGGSPMLMQTGERVTMPTAEELLDNDRIDFASAV